MVVQPFSLDAVQENVDNALVVCESQRFGGVCHIQCKPSFLVDGTLGVTSYKRSCTAVGLWSGSTLACEQNRDSCFMPQPLLNGNVKCSGWFVNDVSLLCILQRSFCDLYFAGLPIQVY